MGKLKALWLTWPVERRREWIGRFEGLTSNTENAKALLEETGYLIKSDSAMVDFRQWAQRQDRRDTEAERQKEDADAITRAHPEWTEQQLREEVIRLSLHRAICDGDFGDLGMKAIAAGQREKTLSLERDKFEAMERRAKQADATEDTLRQSMSDAERAQRIKEIYGLK